MIIRFTYDPNPTGVKAFFDEDDGNIYISAKLDCDESDIIIAHEEQHRACFNSKCWCWGTTFWEEYHAMKAEFEYVVTENDFCLSDIYFGLMYDDLKRYHKLWKKGVGEMRAHYLALRKLCKTRMFKEYAESVNTQWSIKIYNLIRGYK